MLEPLSAPPAVRPSLRSGDAPAAPSPDALLHPALQGLSDSDRIRACQLAVESCLHALRCLPGDEVIKALIRRDLYAQGGRDAGTDEVPPYVHAAIRLFS